MVEIVALSKFLSPGGRQKIVTAIAQRLARITRNNFGPFGIHRPQPWPALSKRYQKRIGYSGPPKLVLSQKLLRSIRVASASPNRAVLVVDTEYASEHQTGAPASKLPARPFLPFNGTTLTPYAASELQKAGEAALNKLMLG